MVASMWSRVVARLHQAVEHGHDDREEGRGGGGHGAGIRGTALGVAARREGGDEQVGRSLHGPRAAVGGVALKPGRGKFAHVGAGSRGFRQGASSNVNRRLA